MSCKALDQNLPRSGPAPLGATTSYTQAGTTASSLADSTVTSEGCPCAYVPLQGHSADEDDPNGPRATLLGLENVRYQGHGAGIAD
jgi:hypothetical protein